MSTPPTHTDDFLLEPEDLANLEREGTIIIIPNSSAHRIHKRRLNRSSEEEYEDVQLPSPSTIVSSTYSTTALASEDYQTIPEFLICRDTLLFLGFNTGTADEVWDRWVGLGPDGGREIDGGPVTFLSMATAQIRSPDFDASTDHDYTWLATMDACGIDQPLQTTIMMPFYKDVRLTASCKYWLIDTIKSRYSSLKEIQAASKERVIAAHHAASRPGGSQQQHGIPSTGQQDGGRSVSSAFSSLPGVSSIHISAPEVRANAPGLTVLYKGANITCLQSAFDAQGRMTEPQHLMSSGVSDFNNTSSNSIYMAMNFDIAKKYAAWAKRRDPNQLAGILRLEVPNAAIESLTHPHKIAVYWPSQRWRELVWTCRRGNRLHGNMVQVRYSTLMIGTICGKPNDIIASLPSPDDITERMLVHNPSGSPAVQFAFTGDQGVDFLADNCSRASRIYPLATRDLDRVESEDLNISGG